MFREEGLLEHIFHSMPERPLRSPKIARVFSPYGSEARFYCVAERHSCLSNGETLAESRPCPSILGRVIEPRPVSRADHARGHMFWPHGLVDEPRKALSRRDRPVRYFVSVKLQRRSGLSLVRWVGRRRLGCAREWQQNGDQSRKHHQAPRPHRQPSVRRSSRSAVSISIRCSRGFGGEVEPANRVAKFASVRQQESRLSVVAAGGYFLRRILCRMSGQNSLARLLRAADSIWTPKFCIVVENVRS